jgi:uncharacterized damage-inducible protein DinB
MGALFESTWIEFILYNNWANQKLLRVCQNLSEDQLEVTIPGAYGSVRDTLGHIMRGEAQYLKILTGSCPQPRFNWDARPGLPEMTAYATQVGEALADTAQRIHPTDQIVEEDEGQQYHYKALAVFIQIINHGIEHRTNITTALNQSGLKPPDVDGWAYLEAHPERFDLK